MAERKYKSSSARSRGATRYDLLDVIRGITIISMVLYHTSWDLVYIFGVGGAFQTWYESQAAFVWQQSICWSFILLSGFCVPLSRRKYRRGLLVFACGLLVTLVTVAFMPQDRIVFGVLTFIGSAMLIAALLYPLLVRVPGIIGFIVNAYLFYLFRHVNSGFVTLYPRRQVLLPRVLYQGYVGTYFGFMDPNFWSTDYFSVLPWIFLFFTGMYLHLALSKEGGFRWKGMRFNVPALSFLGRHSLLIYLLHQPVVYAVLSGLHGIGLL